MRPFVVALAVLALAAPAFADDPPAAGTDGKPADPIVALLAQLKDDQPPEVRLEAVKQAKVLEDPRLVPALGKLLRAPEEDVRVGAMAALGARGTPETKKKAAAALIERLKPLDATLEKDATRKPEMIALCKALHDLAQPSSIDPLLDGIEFREDLEVVEARAMAVANVADVKAVDGMIDLMGRRHRDGTGIRAVLSKALYYATGAKLGNDADAWRSWWKDAKVHFDFEAAAEQRAKAREAKEAKEAAKDAAKEKRKPKKKDGETTPGDGGTK